MTNSDQVRQALCAFFHHVLHVNTQVICFSEVECEICRFLIKSLYKNDLILGDIAMRCSGEMLLEGCNFGHVVMISIGAR